MILKLITLTSMLSFSTVNTHQTPLNNIQKNQNWEEKIDTSLFCPVSNPSIISSSSLQDIEEQEPFLDKFVLCAYNKESKTCECNDSFNTTCVNKCRECAEDIPKCLKCATKYTIMLCDYQCGECNVYCSDWCGKR